MTTQAETRDQIPIEDIKKYRDVDIPIRPIKTDGTPDVFSVFYECETTISVRREE